MKFKKIMLVSIFLLAILTLGAVSATDDVSDSLTVDDVVDGAIDSSDDGDLIADDDDDYIDDDDYMDDDGEDDEPTGTEPVTMNVQVPKEIIAGREFAVNVTFDKPVSGHIYVNDEESSVYDEYSTQIDFTTWDMGFQTLSVRYSGDSTYAPQETYVSFTVSKYDIQCNLRDNLYGENNTLELWAPNQFGSDIKILVNGKDEYYVSLDEDDEYLYELPPLNYGKNTIMVTYSDSTYGNFNKTFDVFTESRFVLQNTYKYGEGGSIYLILPNDATGTVELYSRVYDDDENPIGTLINKTQMKNGRVDISVAGFPLGYTGIVLKYVNDNKYEVGMHVDDVTIIPRITGPKIAMSNQAYVDVYVPASVKGTVVAQTYVYDEDLDEDISREFEGTISNGHARISLNGLDGGSSTLYFTLNDESFEENDFEITILDLDEMSVISSIEDGQDLLPDGYYFSIYMPDALGGIAKVYIDNKLIDTLDCSGYVDNEYYLPDYNLTKGKHVIKVEYTGNELNFTETCSFNIVSVLIDIPDEMEVNYDSISVYLEEDLEGTIVVNVDGKEYDRARVYNTTYFSFDLDDVSLKVNNPHKVYVAYTDVNGKVVASKTKNVKLTYNLGLDCDDEYVYGEQNYLYVNVPYDITGNLVVKIDGKEYKWTSNGYQVVVDISKLSFDYHEVVVSLTGDKKYYDNFTSAEFSIAGVIQYYDAISDRFNEKISLTLPSDAEGNLVVVINKATDFDEYDDPIYEEFIYKEIPLVKGKATYSLNDLGYGSYEMYLSYDGDDYYVWEEETTFSVYAGVASDNDFIYFNQTADILIQGSNNPGKLNVTVYYINDETSDEEDHPVYNLTKLSEEDISFSKSYVYKFVPGKMIGDYKIDFVYSENGIVISRDSQIIYVGPIFEIPDTCVFNSTNVVSISVASDAKGKGVLEIYNDYDYDDESEPINPILIDTVEANFVNGKASLALPKDLAVGYYNIKLSGYTDAGNFSERYGIYIAPSITIPKELNQGETGSVGFALDGAEGQVTVIVSGKQYKVDVVDGKANIPLSNLATGSYEVQVKYTGRDGVSYSTDSILTVKTAPNMTVTTNTATVSSGLIFKVDVGDKLVNGNVTVNIKGVEKTATFENGVATIKFDKLAVGTYNAVVTFNGNNKYDSVSKNVTAKVWYDPIVKASNMVSFYNEGRYSVVVYGYNHKLATNTWVVIKVNGKVYKKVRTNSRGVAVVKLTQTPNRYRISVTALGKTVNRIVTVKHVVTLKAVTVKKSAKSLVLTATLKSKKPIRGKYITFRFNGKVLKAKTNARGIAKVTVSKVLLNKLRVGRNVVYQATYLKETVKRVAKVRK